MNTQKFSQLDRYPSLPSDMKPGAAALWASTTILVEGLKRQWDIGDIRNGLFVLAIMPAFEDSDEAIRAQFELALAQVRSSTAPKQ